MTKPKNKSPAFQLYPKDFLSDAKVIVMPPAARGIYITLLCIDWLEDGFPRADMEALSAAQSMTPEERKGALLLVERCFTEHPTKPDFVTNPRLVKVREEQAEWREKSSEGGKKSGKTRKAKALSGSYQGKGGSLLVGTKDEPKGNTTSSSPTPSTNSLSKEREEQPTSKKQNWPPEGEEVAPLVFLTEAQKEYLKKNFSSSEIIYWLKELATSAGHNPTLWKKKYKNHMAVITSWRKRKLEDGYNWNEARRLYEKQGYRRQEPAAVRPNLNTFKPEPQKIKPTESKPEDIKAIIASSPLLAEG